MAQRKSAFLLSTALVLVLVLSVSIDISTGYLIRYRKMMPFPKQDQCLLSGMLDDDLGDCMHGTYRDNCDRIRCFKGRAETCIHDEDTDPRGMHRCAPGYKCCSLLNGINRTDRKRKTCLELSVESCDFNFPGGSDRVFDNDNEIH